MLVDIDITDNDIIYAEGILLPAGKVFDNERRTFIKNLSTIDLQAVPGSGKTTALLAKLLIIARKLPFVDGSGILVISHTNTAIDEIKEKIGKHCPGLFSYPNFCGTIQSFADEFLARPYYSNAYKKRIVRIDNEIYDELISGFSHYSFSNFSLQEQNNAKRYLRAQDLFKAIRLSHDVNNNIILTKEYNGPTLPFSKPRGNTRPENYTDWSNAEKLRVSDWLFAFKKNILNKGILCFDDAYFLAFQSLIKYPKQKKLLQKRFSFVFVDEMQDMDKHQYDLLEKIFWDEGHSTSKYQRIGDKNQAIFNGDVKLDEIWTDRPDVLQLNGSHRLNVNIANVVQRMALTNILVVGQQKNDDGTDIAIKPHLIVYNENSKIQVIPKFAEIVEAHRNNNLIPANAKHIYKAIAWSTKQEANKTRLCDYYPTFSRDENKPKIDYNSLESYLIIFDKKLPTLEPVRKNILNALLRILRMENIVDNTNERNYSKRRLINFISANHPEAYEKLKLLIFQWSRDITKGQKANVLISIKQYIPEFLILFGSAINRSNDFINAPHIENAQANAIIAINPNTYKTGNTEVHITTIHSVKGQTHTGTLYLETFYSRGQGNYESERLAAQLKGQAFNPNASNLIKQSAKMMYVGLSRPTHLICLAVQKSRFDEKLTDISRDTWEIIEI